MKYLHLFLWIIFLSSLLQAQDNIKKPNPYPEFIPYENVEVNNIIDEETDYKKLGKEQPARWLSVDPLADMYPGWSPYNYTSGNPINRIDPTGMDWYSTTDSNGTVSYHYNKDLTEDNVGDILTDGQSYVGIEFLYFSGNSLDWMGNDGTITNYGAASGLVVPTDGSQLAQATPNVGPVPEGNYSLDPQQTQNWGNLNAVQRLLGTMGRGQWPGAGSSWGYYRTPLQPTEVVVKHPVSGKMVKRSNMFIHGGLIQGSRGCIDLTGSNTSFHRRFLNHNKVMKLKVKY